MKPNQAIPKTVNDYIARFPKEIQAALKTIRRAIREAAPKATEAISWQMPTFKQNGNLVHFAAWKKHVGFYPASSGIKAFKKELAAFDGAKGSVQFPYDQPMPLGLIKKIVKFRIKENLAKAKAKKKNVTADARRYTQIENQ